MFGFFEKRKIRRWLYSPLCLLCLGLLVALLWVPTFNAYTKMQQTIARKDEVAQELHSLRIRKAQLQSEIDRLATPLGVEAELRSKYDVGREGERVIVIVEE